ncbi:hypothetical protein [Thiohalophilus sp.]|uniref:hypothetical protein n=1 Tax=Thiohalophilus sp. TaxID=3028392 RepID=UPI002ACEC360|nr:hypothetical protein [Thiohalophilus sp.]MDZ7805204.1 hypothetical protein [Thiohalophilus sp.]
MTSIKVIPDDRGTQSLRADNLRPQATGPVSAITGTRALQTGETHPPPTPRLRIAHPRIRRRLLAERRTRPDRRRHQERRRTNRPVMLDTRSQHERRRRAGRRRSDRSSPPVRHGIDTEV